MQGKIKQGTAYRKAAVPCLQFCKNALFFAVIQRINNAETPAIMENRMAPLMDAFTDAPAKKLTKPASAIMIADCKR